MKRKPLNQQVIVITGASSGIGHAVARLAAAAGARVALSARSKEPFETLAEDIRRGGGAAIAVEADVRRMEDMEDLSRRAIAAFGAYDTWINNAGVSIYGLLEEVPLDEQRGLFDTNYWGVVHGSLAAVRHLKQRGGTLINIGSTLSDRALPLQGAYSASKHAVKAFTDSLRMELEREGADVSVTLIKPGAIATPYAQHAKNYLEHEPDFPPPVYAPEVAAKAILHCAERPRRDLFVGSGGRILSLLGTFAPRAADHLMEKTAFGLQESDRPSRVTEHRGLDSPSGEGIERGELNRHVKGTSAYTAAVLHPFAAGFAALVAGYLLWRLFEPRRGFPGKAHPEGEREIVYH